MNETLTDPESDTQEDVKSSRALAAEIAGEFATVLATSDLQDLEDDICYALKQARVEALEEFIAAIEALPTSAHPEARWSAGRAFGVSLAKTTLQNLLSPTTEAPDDANPSTDSESTP